MTFKTFNKDNIVQVRIAIQQKLDELKEECGLTVTLDTLRYKQDGTGLTSKITATPELDPEFAEEAAIKSWKLMAPSYGLPEEGYGAVIQSHGRRLKVVGLVPSRRVNTLTLIDIDSGDECMAPPAFYTQYAKKQGLPLAE